MGRPRHPDERLSGERRSEAPPTSAREALRPGHTVPLGSRPWLHVRSHLAALTEPSDCVTPGGAGWFAGRQGWDPHSVGTPTARGPARPPLLIDSAPSSISSFINIRIPQTYKQAPESRG